MCDDCIAMQTGTHQQPSGTGCEGFYSQVPDTATVSSHTKPMLDNTYNSALGQTLGVEIRHDTIGGPQCPVKTPLLQFLRGTQAEDAALSELNLPTTTQTLYSIL